MTRSAIVPAILAICAAGSAAALDHEFAYAPLALGVAPGTTPEYFVGVDSTLKSKLTDDYRVVADDTAMGIDGQFRAYGLGIALKTDWAVGQSTDYSRPGNKNSPGELLRTELDVNWALEIRDPRDASIPLLQIIPHVSWITYPNQAPIYTPVNDNYLKGAQRWLGLDAWWALPVEGVELGGGIEYNLSTQWRATRGGVGAREFVQYNSIDIATWQLANFGDSDYRNVIAGEDSIGMDAIVAGGRATVPMFAEDVYGFVQVEISYWADKGMRDHFSAAGQDNGDVVLAFGVNWMPK